MSLAEDAAKRVNRQELIDLALTICNIDSAGPTEARVAEYFPPRLRSQERRSVKRCRVESTHGHLRQPASAA